MKKIISRLGIILLLVAAGVWAYFNVDFTGIKNRTQDGAMNTIKQEKTINKFFDADKQNKQETQNTINENF